MQETAKHMSIPPDFADKWNLKIWKDFEKSADESMALSNLKLKRNYEPTWLSISSFVAKKLMDMLTNEMQPSEDGLLCKMKAANLSNDMITRIISDLMIAAGDTVNKNKNSKTHIFSFNYPA